MKDKEYKKYESKYTDSVEYTNRDYVMKDKLKQIIRNALNHEGNASQYQLENRTNLLLNDILELISLNAKKIKDRIEELDKERLVFRRNKNWTMYHDCVAKLDSLYWVLEQIEGKENEK